MIEINTKIYYIDDMNLSAVKNAGEIIKRGGLVAFPTETVYGLGAGIMHEDALKNIFRAKGRPSDNPLIVHIAYKDDITSVAKTITPCAKALADAFMPGPITLVVEKKNNISDTVTAGLNTVAVRCPEHKIAHELIKASGEPIAAPSANLSGKPSPTKASHVIADMNGRIDVIIAADDCRAGVESTVVDVTGDVPVILRPGVITREDIQSVTGAVQTDRHVTEQVKSDEIPKSPGMKYKHYAPDAEVICIEGNSDKVKKKVIELLSENKDKKIGIISYLNDYNLENTYYAGKNSEEYAHNLFSFLREFDDIGTELVLAEFKEDEGCGLAVQNRLYKACGYNVIHV